MSKLIYNNEGVKLIKRKNGFKKFKLFAFLTLCFLSVISLSVVFSEALTVGNFSVWNLFNNDVKVKPETLYFVNMDKFKNYNEAENMAELVALQGASGFIWQMNDDYVIVGNVYFTKEQANFVLENLKKTNPDVFVSEVNFKGVKLNLENYTKEQKHVVKNALNNIDKVIKSLYEITIKLETKEITPTTASSKVNDMKAQSVIIGNALDVLNSVSVNESVIKIKNSYILLCESLNELVLKLISSQSYQSISKHTYVQVIKLKYDLLQNL